MKFIIIIYTANKLTVVEMEDIRGVRLRKFKLRKIVLGVRMHFYHTTYDPAIISISITPAAGKADLVPACMFTLQHVDCVEIDMRVDIDTQDFLLCGVAYTQVVRRVWSGTLLLKSSTRVGRQNALGLE